MESWALQQTRQCQGCPWLKGSTTDDIPGYDPEKHKSLASTIAEPGSIRLNESAMACHDSPDNDSRYCIGWLSHQMGAGNNIGMRVKMIGCSNASDIRLAGPQEENFEGTFDHA